MQVHVPDPGYTRSERARANFRLAAALAVGFVALLWFIEILNLVVAPGLEAYGVRPREWSGLPGILLAPLLHSGFEHLLANTPPLLVLGTAMLYLYPGAAFKVLPAIYLGPGIAVWLFGPEGSNHIGASGLVYGMVGYVLVAGLIRRDRRAIGASLVVWFMYGALTWGVMPLESGVSWQTHLAAAAIGALLALALRHRDVPPRVRYTWEGEAGDECGSDTFEEGNVEAGAGEREPAHLDEPRTLH